MPMTGDVDPGERSRPCPACGRLNHGSARFCDHCAVALAPDTAARDDSAARPSACTACGHRNHEDAHFCQGCGSPMDVGTEPPWYRRRGVVVAVVLGALVVAVVLSWAVAATRDGADGDRDDVASSSTTTSSTAASGGQAPADTAPTPAATSAPAPAPSATVPSSTAALPAPLTAPVLTSANPSCDTAGACSISVTWQHAGGADGYRIVADRPGFGDVHTSEVGPTARSARIDGLAPDTFWCVVVVAFRGAEDVYSDSRCRIDTGSG